MGCLAKIGCLAILLVVGVAAWFTRPYWMPYLDRDDTAAALPMWQPLTAEGAARAGEALRELERDGGPMYVTIPVGELASFIVTELTRTLPSSADSIEVAAIDDRLRVRASVRVTDLGDRSVLGPFASLVGERERMEIAGDLAVIRPGLTELRIREFRVRDFAVPDAVIPALVRQVMRGERPEGLSPEGIPLRTPEHVADVRLRDGRVTLYKPTQ